MDETSTAILHLRPPFGAHEDAVADSLRRTRGVMDVAILSTEGLLTIRFDRSIASLGDLVRTAEDAGSVVASVAERPVPIVTVMEAAKRVL